MKHLNKLAQVLIIDFSGFKVFQFYYYFNVFSKMNTSNLHL